MTVVLTVALCVAAVLLWTMSGRSPLVWAAWLLLHAEAVRVQAVVSIAVAIRDFRDSYPGRAEEVRAESTRGMP